MKNANKKAASVIKKIAETMADRAYGAASIVNDIKKSTLTS